MSNYEKTEKTVDTNTGEVNTIIKSFSVKKKKVEKFFFVFTKNIMKFYDIERAIDFKILFFLSSHIEFSTKQIKFSRKEKLEFMETVNIKTQCFSNSIKRLKDLGIISGERGDYLINSDYINRGKI